MIAGRGKEDQAGAHALKAQDRATFQALIDRITEATILYLSAQVQAGAEVVKLFDSWAGSLKGQDFTDFAVKPAARIIAALKALHPGLPVIAFPREAGNGYIGFAKATGADCVALDNSVTPEWAAEHVQKDGCVQGNLAPEHMVTGGEALIRETRRVVQAFAKGPHIFNLGHGITPDANPDNVKLMIDTVRGGNPEWRSRSPRCRRRSVRSSCCGLQSNVVPCSRLDRTKIAAWAVYPRGVALLKDWRASHADTGGWIASQSLQRPVRPA